MSSRCRSFEVEVEVEVEVASRGRWFIVLNCLSFNRVIGRQVRRCRELNGLFEVIINSHRPNFIGTVIARECI